MVGLTERVTLEGKFSKYIKDNISGVVIPVAFAVVLAWYNYQMVQSYNYTIFDLGISYRPMALLIFNHFFIFRPPLNILYPNYPLKKMAIIPLSIGLLAYNSIFTVLLEQILVISAGGYALYRITRIKTGSILASVILELSYFLYPATYGFMTHGGNIQIFFPGFLLIGYLFFIEKKTVPSILAFAMASITNQWGPFIVLGFIVIDWIANTEVRKINLAGLRFSGLRSSFLKAFRERKRAFFYVFMFGFEILLGSFIFLYLGGSSGVLGNSHLSGVSPTSYIGNLLSNLGTWKIPFLYQIFSPVLLLSLLTPYSVLVIAYYIISLFPNYPGFYSLTQQYPSIFYAFVFIGTAHFFRNKFSTGDVRKLAKRILVLVLISSIFSFAIYSPFSVSSFQNGTVQEMANVSQFDQELTAGLSLIPNNASVFIQNDLPQLMNRAMVYEPGFYDNQTVDYAVIIPFGFSPISDAFGGYSPYWANMFAHNSSYGIYEYIQGAIVYKLHYSGHPVIYIPSSGNTS